MDNSDSESDDFIVIETDKNKEYLEELKIKIQSKMYNIMNLQFELAKLEREYSRIKNSLK